MAGTNGDTPDFTHRLGSFELEGHTFHRKKVPSREWAETLERVRIKENEEIAKTEGSVLFAVSAEGLQELVRLGIREEDRAVWDKLWTDGLLEFGELSSLRDWMWEQMTERPFTSDTPSSDGPGQSNEASSKVESSSVAEVQRG